MFKKILSNHLPFSIHLYKKYYLFCSNFSCMQNDKTYMVLFEYDKIYMVLFDFFYVLLFQIMSPSNLFFLQCHLAFMFKFISFKI